MKCERCNTSMFCSEYHDSEVLHPNCSVHNRRIRHECPACGVTMTLVIPTMRISGPVPAVRLQSER